LNVDILKNNTADLLQSGDNKNADKWTDDMVCLDMLADANHAIYVR